MAGCSARDRLLPLRPGRRRDDHGIPERAHLRRQGRRAFCDRRTCWCEATRSSASRRSRSRATAGATTLLIDGGGRTLMPGLIDMHWHTMLVRPTPVPLLTDDIGYLNLVAGAEATDTLMRGFTTVRDLGGPAFGLKRAIDEGIVVGPRIYPSGAIITVTSGHGDFRQPFELPRTLGAPQSRDGTAGRQHGRRQSGRGARARARATDAGRHADQADRRRRRGVAAQSARCHPPSPSRSCAPPSRPRRTGAPMSRCMPTRPHRSSARSRPA